MNAIADSPRLITKAQLAAALGVKLRKVQKMTAAEEIPVLRLSSHCIRYDLAAVLEALRTKFEQPAALGK